MPYKSLLHYRNANNKRFSLHESLLAISHCFCADTTESTEAETVSDDESPPPSPKIQGRATRGTKPALQVQVNLSAITGSTPQRSVRKTIDKLAKGIVKPKRNQQVVVDRVLNCTGFPVWSENARGTCVICGAETLWYCIGCHVGICVNNIADDKKEKSKHVPFDCYEMDVTIAALPGSGAVPKSLSNVANSCYLLHHRAAIFKALGASNKKD